MKRSAIDVLRRGFDNALANWPLIVIHIAEGVALVLIVVAAVFAAVMPVLVSAGLSKFDFGNPENASQLIASLVIEHWVLLLYLVALALVIFAVLIAVHSFVEAGAAQVYVDAERAVAQMPAPPRTAFNVFRFDRWLRGGARRWWAVFWIYNLAWSAGALIILVPLVLTLGGMLAVSEVSSRVAVGFLGLVVTVLLFVPIAVVTGMWTQRAIADCVARLTGAADSLRAAWRQIQLDFGRHIAITLLVIVISLIASSLLSGMTIPVSFGNHRHLSLLPLIFAPVQMVISLIHSAVSAAMSSWYLASFVALTEE